MLVQEFTLLFKRDLARLAQEIEAYPDENSLWQRAEGIRNGAGNLCLHLVGNLNTYIGAVLGHTDYVRDREAEFETTGVPRAVLLRDVCATSRMVAETLAALPAARLPEPYPEAVLGYPMTTQYFLLHLHGHLTYHLGQIGYHRRLLTNSLAVRFVD